MGKDSVNESSESDADMISDSELKDAERLLSPEERARLEM